MNKLAQRFGVVSVSLFGSYARGEEQEDPTSTSPSNWPLIENP
jgi:predicted nucleotidyltransferase